MSDEGCVTQQLRRISRETSIGGQARKSSSFESKTTRLDIVKPPDQDRTHWPVAFSGACVTSINNKPTGISTFSGRRKITRRMVTRVKNPGSICCHAKCAEAVSVNGASALVFNCPANWGRKTVSRSFPIQRSPPERRNDTRRSSSVDDDGRVQLCSTPSSQNSLCSRRLNSI